MYKMRPLRYRLLAAVEISALKWDRGRPRPLAVGQHEHAFFPKCLLAQHASEGPTVPEEVDPHQTDHFRRARCLTALFQWAYKHG